MDGFDELSLTECWDFLAEVISSEPFVKHFPETFAYLAKNWEQDSPAAQEYRPNRRLWYLYSGDRRGGLKLRRVIGEDMLMHIVPRLLCLVGVGIN